MAITTVSSHVVSVNAIQGTLIADNAITAVHIATNAVSGTLIADNAVTATHIAQNTITVTQIADDAIEAAKIADGVITTNHLNKAMISSQTEVTAVAGDFLLIGDTSDSNNLKKIPISGITALVDVSSKLNLSGGTMSGALNMGSQNITAVNRISTADGITDTGQAGSSTVFNDSGSTADFRIESTGNANMFVIDGGLNTCTIGGDSSINRGNQTSGELLLGGTTDGGFVDFDGSSLQLNTQRDPNTGTFINTSKSHGGITITGNDADSHIKFYTASANNTTATERMRIDKSGNVGIGTTSPAQALSVNGNIEMTSTQGRRIFMGGIAGTTFGMAYDSQNPDYGIFYTEATPDAVNISPNGNATAGSMTIYGNNRVGIGTQSANAGLTVASGDIRATAAAFANDANSISMSQESSGGFITARGPSTSERGVLGLSVNRSNGAAGIVAIKINNGGSINYGGHTGEATGSTGGITMSVDNNDRMNFICATTGTGNLELIEFRNPNGTVGDIKSNGSSTSYNTSSDYRLKENINYTWDATTRLKQLKPARFNFKTDTDKTLDGFLAHEVSSIVPEAISGEKDGEKMQSIDQSKLVPLLVKTIQELEARITTLEG